MTKDSFAKLPEEEKIKKYYDFLDSLHDKPMLLMSVTFRRINNISMGERILIEKMINEYTYEDVREAFIEVSGLTTEKQTLAYIRGIAKTIHQRKTVQKNVDESNQLKKELNQDFIKPGFFDDVKKKYGWKNNKPKVDGSYKQTQEYKNKEIRFKQEFFE